ncbi:MAG TPA: hypothetical protein VJ725_07310 [Thermoanaerobaculia bacterium]|nr:hypothetical protein [Thermoanaerobaculia bacterium]
MNLAELERYADRIGERETQTALKVADLEQRLEKLENDREGASLRTDLLKGEADLLREKLARKTRELSEMANAYANTRLAAGNRLARIEVLESEVRELREMNEAHLGQISELERQAAINETANRDLRRERDWWAVQASSKLAECRALQDDLVQAREKGLSLGNAALRKGWEDCEKAVFGLLDREIVGYRHVLLVPSAETALTFIKRGIESRAHHTTAWTGAEEAVAAPCGGAQAPSGAPLQDWQRDALDHPIGRLSPAPIVVALDELKADPFRYPAGLPEEDPGSAPEPESVGAMPESPAPGTPLRGTTCIVVDPEPLRELAAESLLHGDFDRHYVRSKLREAGAIPGEVKP